MKAFDVVTFGTATQDIFMKPRGAFDIEPDRHAPEGKAIALPLDAKIEIAELTFTTGGGATNAAVTFARQGLHTACVCAVGDDMAAEAVVRDLDREKVFAGFVKRKQRFSTAYGVILEVERAGRTILVYRGVSQMLELSDVPLAKLRAKWFYLAPLGGRMSAMFGPLVRHGHHKGIRMAADLSKDEIHMGLRRLSPMLNKLDVLKINREEASYLTGVPFKKEKEIFSALDKVVKGIVIVTDGPRGLTVSDGRTMWRAGTFKERRVADRTGAGDAFGSAFVVALARKRQFGPKDVTEAIRLASANATSVVEHTGAKPGILSKKDAGAGRWKRFRISSSPISSVVNPYRYPNL